ncbi:MAG TPA: pitrilysin family protein [Longimicrobium sp.]|jgi:predicted Zn-dependent peptidase|uniref:M16 family metallopeptidase n=1 Tax=Longimicrobium sp. TaxID=2029185 RepID=UPI002ED83C2E
MKRTLLSIAAGAALLGGPAAAQDFPTTPPRATGAPRVDLPEPVRMRLPNGLTVMYVQQRELPVVSAVLVTRGAGSADEPAQVPGLASFTASMLDEGAGGRDALALASALDLLGASLSTGSGTDAAQANLYVLRQNFPAALRIMADVVTRPDFPEREVNRLRDERLTALARARDEATTIANNAFASLVYGAQHPYGRVPTAEGTRALDRGRVQGFHAARYRPESSTLILVGDVDPAAMQPMVAEAFGAWRAQGPAAAGPAELPQAPSIGRTVVYLIDKPGAAQSEIRIGHPGVPRSSPDFFPVMVMNTMLGGTFTSRLNTNLRETHGWAYGASSNFAMLRGAGPFTARAGVQTNATDSALVEFFRELNRIRTEAVTPTELDKIKNFVALRLPGQLETTSDIAGQLAALETYGLDASYFDDYVQRVMAVTADDLRRVASEYIRPDRAVVVVVGDRQVVEAAVRAANVGPVEIREVTEFVR